MDLSGNRISHALGITLAALSVAFVGFRLLEQGAQLDLKLIGKDVWVATAAYAIVYGFANLALLLAWINLLMHFEAKTHFLTALRVYGLSQLAKYVPGNIFHLASRQGLGVAEGLNGWVLAKTAAWELGLISICGLIFLILLLPWILPAIQAPSAVILFIIFIAATGLILRQLSSPCMMRAFLWQTAFLLVSGVLFTALLATISDFSDFSFSTGLVVCGAYIIAWLAGFITPGAPAGAGIRELVLLMLLKGNFAEATVLSAIVLSRVATISGDFLFFIAASFSRKRSAS